MQYICAIIKWIKNVILIRIFLFLPTGASDPVDSSVCGSISTGKQGCGDSQATVINDNKFNFAFWTCSTPVVHSVSTNNGTTQTPITITGGGFSSIACQNEVNFGGYSCDVISSSESSLTCNLAKSGEPTLGILHQLEMRVSNRGLARINIRTAEDRGFAVRPTIDHITPTSGSLAGGARLTITGFGFGDLQLVTVGSAQCTIIDSSYSKIICETPMTVTQGEKEVTVYAYVNGIPLPAECETQSNTCIYSYANLWTPILSTISPDTMSSSTIFNITGTYLGNNRSELHVTIGGVLATVTEAANNYILVSVDNLPAGDNNVIVRVKDYGKASGNLVVAGSLVITTISPSSGSIHGETTISIEGNGFVNDTSVTIGGSPCYILSTSLSEVTCITQLHSAGSVNVAVTSNGLSYSFSSYNYDSGVTPTISTISPMNGFAGDILTITGTNLNGGAVTILLGQSGCDFISGTSTEIQCTIGNHATGRTNLFVHVNGIGAANSDIQFEYQLSIASITPSQGENHF